MFLIRSISLFTAALLLANPVVAADKPLTKEEIKLLVKETLMEEPQIIADALTKLREEQEMQKRKDAAAALEGSKKDLFENKDLPAAGASMKKAEVTIVEFFDYHCGYCKRFLPQLTKALEEEKNLRIVFVDLPILSQDSEVAARAAIAVSHLDKDKYFEFHTALMNKPGKFDKASLLKMAEEIGIDGDKLEKEMEKKEVSKQLEKNRDLAAKLNIRGTPGIVIGNNIIPGALSYDELKGQIAIARREAKKK